MSVTQSQLTAEIQIVREETVLGANTKDRIAGILDDINSIIEINTVSYVPQTLNSSQQLQALNNIGAASNIFNSTVDGKPIYNGNVMAMLSDITTPTNIPVVTTSLFNGNIKINGVETRVYTIPTSLSPNIIAQNTTNRFVTDTQINLWNLSDTVSDVNSKINSTVLNCNTFTTLSISNLLGQKGQANGFATLNSNSMLVQGVDASNIISGVIDASRLPRTAFQRLVFVTNQAAMYNLTTANVNLGDTVQTLDTLNMYFVSDITNLNNAAGYTPYTALLIGDINWYNVTNTQVNNNGDLIITLSDSTVINAGHVAGTNGTSVTTATINGSGNLIITLSDLSVINAGVAQGNTGESAYQIALDNGYIGTSAEWIASLHGLNGFSTPVNVVINKIGSNGLIYPIIFKWTTNLTVSNVELTSNCSEISVTISGIVYNHTTLIGIPLASGTEMVINDITITTGYTNANAIIIFTQS